jgi:ABC-type Fe3+ transport system substrate-binding protein
MTDYSSEPRKSGAAGKLVFVFLILIVCAVGYLGYTMMGSQGGGGGQTGTTPGTGSGTPDGQANAGGTPTGAQPAARPASEVVEINIAYGTEKKLWLNWAVGEFEKTESGQRIKVNLHGRGSVEGAREVISGPGDIPFHVWSPASSAYRDVFETDWAVRHGSDEPIIRAENLALSPMIFVMWKERYEGYRTKYDPPNFQNIAEAMHEAGGWSAIAGKADWGLFKFGHTHPGKSNSGLMTLVLMAYDFHGKERNLSLGDITSTDFQQWLQRFERAVARPGGELSHSTGSLMKEMVLRGPSQFDVLMVYENLAIDYLKAAQGRWGELFVVYPERNLWNENPYYILDVPWSEEEHRLAAAEFLDFLMSDRIQARALEHGFRPGNPLVPINGPDSPFVRYADYGLKIDIPRVCDPPRAEVLNNLLASFQRIDR